MLDTKTYNQKVQESVKALATFMTSEKDLLSPKAREKKVTDELMENVHFLQNKMYEGLTACIEGIKLCSDPVMPVDKIVQELRSCTESIKTIEQLTSMGENLFKDSSWKKQLGISNKCMQALYQGAKNWFESKNYVLAEQAFFVICNLDPSQFAYWVGLGHASFQNTNYDQAINAYAMASGMALDNVWPHIWAANCFEAKNDKEFAKNALHEAIVIQKASTTKNSTLLQSLEERMKKL